MGAGEWQFDIVAPLALYRLTAAAQDANGFPLTGSRLRYRFIDRFGEATTLLNFTIDSRGEETLFAPPLDDNGEHYEVTLEDNGFWGYDTTEVPVRELDGDRTLISTIFFEDSERPVILAGPYAAHVSDTAAYLEWFTDEPTRSIVEIDGRSMEGDGLYTHHKVTIDGLQRGQGYEATVTARDPSGNDSLTTSVGFTTLVEVDSTLPVFQTLPALEQVTHNQMVVALVTDEPTTATVEVRAGDTVVAVAESLMLTSNHRVTLEGLAPEQEYQVYAFIIDAAGNGPAASVPVAAQTRRNTDTTPPRFVRGPLIQNVKPNQVTVLWETDEPAISGISYNKGGDHRVFRNDTFTRHHTATLSGLEGDTRYQLTVSATDEYDNGPSLSRTIEFFTLDTADTDPPVLVGAVGVSGVGVDVASITFLTDEPADARIFFGETEGALSQMVVDATPQTYHRVPLAGLRADTTYFYRVLSADVVGNEVATDIASFSTKPADQRGAPRFVTLPRLARASDDALTVSWRTDVAGAGTLTCHNNGTGEVHQDFDEAPERNQQLTVGGLAAGAYYTCSATVQSVSGETTTALVSAQALGQDSIQTLSAKDVQAPGRVGAVQASYVSDRAIAVAWSTNELADAQVRYRQTGTERYRYAGNLTHAREHEIVIPGLQPDNEYEFVAVSTDADGNTAQWGTYRWRTATEPDAEAPEFIQSPAISAFARGVFELSWAASEPVHARVRYGTAPDRLKYTESSDGLALSDSVILTDLSPGAPLYAEVRLIDLARGSVTSEMIVIDAAADADADGMGDLFETVHGLDPNDDSDAGEDPDGDALTNLEESVQGTNPNVRDTDGDGEDDGVDTLPLDPSASFDSDGDGVPDLDDDVNNLVANGVYRFRTLWPNLPGAWQYQNVRGLATDDAGRAYVLEAPGAGQALIKVINHDGRLIRRISLDDLASTWTEVAGLVHVDRQLLVVAYHPDSDGVAGYRLHILNTYGRVLADVALDGMHERLEGYVPGQVNSLVVTGDELTILTNATAAEGGPVALLRYGIGAQVRGALLGSENLAFPGSELPMKLAVDTRRDRYYIGMTGGECGEVAVLDASYIETARIDVAQFRQSSCGFVHGLALDDKGRLYINAGDEIYLVSNGALVAQAAKGDSGFRDQFISYSSFGYLYEATQGYLRLFDQSGGNRMRVVEDFSAFGQRQGRFVDESVEVHAGSDGQVYTYESRIQRVQAFDPAGNPLSQWFSQSADGTDVRFDDFVVDNLGRVFALVNGENDAVIHRYATDGSHETAWSLGVPARALSLNGADGLLVLSGSGATGSVHHYSADGDETAFWQTIASATTLIDVANSGGWIRVLSTDTLGDSIDPRYHLDTYAADGTFRNRVDLGARLYGGSTVTPFMNMSAGGDRLAIGWGPEVHIYTGDGVFISAIAERGDVPGVLSARTLASAGFTPSGELLVADTANGRIQVFDPMVQALTGKAVILAGGGPYLGNSLWDATEMHASFAYRTLLAQGYRKEQIRYLNPTRHQDLDGNGQFDDVADIASLSTLRSSIRDWAGVDEDLLVYLIDHGGPEVFRINRTEMLTPGELNEWLGARPSTIVYDACQSGSFQQAVSAPGRVVITSSDEVENAYFLARGAISFSGPFWQGVLNGQDLQASFSAGVRTLGVTGLEQTPQVTVDGVEGTEGLEGRFIGLARPTGTPAFEVSFDTRIEDGAALLSAEVAGSGAVNRVWVVVWSDQLPAPQGVNPVLELPTVELRRSTDASRFEGRFEDVDATGQYHFALFVRGRGGDVAGPVLSRLDVTAERQDRVVILSAGTAEDPRRHAIDSVGQAAFRALTTQGVSERQIRHLSIGPAGGSVSTVGNTLSALGDWAGSNTQDLIVVLQGRTDHDALRLADGRLAFSQLTDMLNSAADSIHGSLTVVADFDGSERLLDGLAPAENDRVLIGSTRRDERALWLHRRASSFSRYFWNGIFRGQTVRDAVQAPSSALDNMKFAQRPWIDDNGDGVVDSKRDGRLARRWRLGAGILTAGDAPTLEQPPLPYARLSSHTSTTIRLGEIVSATGVARVHGELVYPSDDRARLPAVAEQPIEFERVGTTNTWTVQLDGLTYRGRHELLVWAENEQGDLAGPVAVLIDKSHGAVLTDTDEDGIDDTEDADDDNDGVSDEDEGDAGTNPLNADSDDDGVTDLNDHFPLDPDEALDADADGIGDNGDNCPDAANGDQADADGDGGGDVCDDDRDGDGVANANDHFPDDIHEWTDEDADGIGSNSDNCPQDLNPSQADYDADGAGDACDADDDNDGTPDDVDAFVFDVTESVDTDGDGTGNNEDPDDDNDGTPDEADCAVLDPLVSVCTRLVNISTRGQVLGGDAVMIGGFVIRGDGEVDVLIRARGPSLADAGVNGTLADPVVELQSVTGTFIASNDNWADDERAAEIPAGHGLAYAAESALVVTLQAGGYTPIVRGVDGNTGVGIVEVFAVAERGDARLINVSTRGQVGAGDDVMIGGLIISGTGARTVTFQARGPGLQRFGVEGVLEDPVLEIFDQHGVRLTVVDDCSLPICGAVDAEGNALFDQREAVISMELAPGAYTAIISGANGATGVGIVEATLD